MRHRDLHLSAGHTSSRLRALRRSFANWPSALGSIAAAGLVGWPLTATFVTRGGTTFRTPNRSWARGVLFEVFADDCYRLDAFLEPVADEPLLVLDIGAHIGSFALRILEIAPGATVHAFEPSSTTAAFLRENVAANDAAERIIVHREAVMGTTGVAAFEDDGAGGSANRVLSSGSASVPTRAFDEVVAALGRAPHLVKLDCEGAEYEIVLGSSDRSWDGVERVVLEHHPRSGHRYQVLERRLHELGFATADREELGPELGTAWFVRRSPSGSGA